MMDYDLLKKLNKLRISSRKEIKMVVANVKRWNKFKQYYYKC